jgi:shikimate kinase
MTVTLIGMPGAGKPCMGKAISKKMNMRVIDGDRLMEQNTGRKLQSIIDEDGLDAFKQLERETLLSIKEDNIIITPGGSAVYYEDVMEHFRSLGVVVYLYVSPQNLIRRLGDFSKRGIVLKPGQTIEDLFEERRPLLEKYAHITVNCDGGRYSHYQSEAIRLIKEFNK